MLIDWQTLKVARTPSMKTFGGAFLIVARGITIRDRLRVLKPSEEENYYTPLNLLQADHHKLSRLQAVNHGIEKLEKTADERPVRVTRPPYTLSFTVGGLFLFEGIELARLHGSCASWEEVRRTAPDDVFVAKGGPSSVERIRNEVIRRLSTLTSDEIDHLATAGMTDARALMWVAACRKYRILAEFAVEVLDERLRSFQPEIRVTDFDALLDAKGVNAAEIARLAPSTRARLRSGAFRMLREAELLDAVSRVWAPRLSDPLRDLLARDPRSGLNLIPGGG